MSVKLFVGTTNGLELRVDERVLEQLKLERENRLAARFNPDGTKRNKKATKEPKPVEKLIQSCLDNFVEHNGCWISKNHTNGDYKKILFCGKLKLLHRMVYLLTRGQVEYPSVCHHCDNPPCCNPAHLFSGTQQMNAMDSVQKGRFNKPSGELSSAAKLVNSQVAAIRDQYRYRSKEFGTVALAEKYKVSQSCISRVVLGQTYLA